VHPPPYQENWTVDFWFAEYIPMKKDWQIIKIPDSNSKGPAFKTSTEIRK
jgi:hypothetical protein